MPSIFERIWTDPTKRKLYCRIPDDHITGGGEAGRSFEENKAYFSLTLSEMWLADARRLWQGFLPLTVALTEFQYAGEKNSVPVFAGKDLLHSIESYMKGQNVEFRNTRLLGPVPYSGGDVALFVGLFRVPGDDLSSELFGVLGDVLGIFDLAGLSGYLKVAKTLAGGLDRVLGLSKTELRAGARDVFDGNGDGGNVLRESYLAYVNSPPDELRPLWVKDGALCSGETLQDAKPMSDHDHCLLNISYHTVRNDYTSLPFHKSWKQAAQLIWQGEAEKAQWVFLDLMQQIAASPDLIPSHRTALMTTYKANFEAEAEAKRLATFTPPAGAVTRSAGNNLAAKHVLTHDASLVEKIVGDKSAGAQLYSVSKQWGAIPYLDRSGRSQETELTDEMLASQLTFVAPSTANAGAVADAFVKIAIGPKSKTQTASG
jgi:hypothetical protein